MDVEAADKIVLTDCYKIRTNLEKRKMLRSLVVVQEKIWHD